MKLKGTGTLLACKRGRKSRSKRGEGLEREWTKKVGDWWRRRQKMNKECHEMKIFRGLTNAYYSTVRLTLPYGAWHFH